MYELPGQDVPTVTVGDVLERVMRDRQDDSRAVRRELRVHIEGPARADEDGPLEPLAHAATARRVAAGVQHLVFAMVALGVTIFVIGLLADTTVIKRIGAPTMGIGLLIGLASFGLALAQDRPDTRTVVSAAPA